jgi:hypothetical protein
MKIWPDSSLARPIEGVLREGYAASPCVDFEALLTKSASCLDKLLHEGWNSCPRGLPNDFKG